MAQTANVATADEVNACLNEFGASQSHLVVSLQKFNGGMHYTDTYVGLGLNEIKQVGTEKGLIARNIVPIAKDIDDSLLSVQINADGTNTMVTLDGSDGSIDEDLKLSYGQYLEQIREKLLSGKLVYEDGLGLISVA